MRRFFNRHQTAETPADRVRVENRAAAIRIPTSTVGAARPSVYRDEVGR